MIPSTIRDRVWIIREAASAHPVLCAAALVTSLLGAALPLASMVATGFLVGSMPETIRDGLDSPAGGRAVQGLIALAAALLANRMVVPAGRSLAIVGACGTGRYAAYLAARGHEVVGVDASPEMLARAGVRVPGADFRLGRLEALPLESASVNLAICALALTHCPALVPPVQELARVVRPGGRLILCDIHPVVVWLGGHALFRDVAGRRAFIRNLWPTHTAPTSMRSPPQDCWSIAASSRPSPQTSCRPPSSPKWRRPSATPSSGSPAASSGTSTVRSATSTDVAGVRVRPTVPVEGWVLALIDCGYATADAVDMRPFRSRDGARRAAHPTGGVRNVCTGPRQRSPSSATSWNWPPV